MAGQPAGDQALGVPRLPRLVNLLGRSFLSWEPLNRPRHHARSPLEWLILPAWLRPLGRSTEQACHPSEIYRGSSRRAKVAMAGQPAGGAPFFPGNLSTVRGTMRASEAPWLVASVALVTRLAAMASVAG